MRRKFITSQDIVEASRGNGRIALSGGEIVTDEAREAALRLGVEFRSKDKGQSEFQLVLNWKMNHGKRELVDFAERIRGVIEDGLSFRLIVCPAFPFLESAQEVFRGLPVEIGAQNVHEKESGSYTGEVSALMLNSVGIRTVIIGHSERRKFFTEDDELIAEKVQTALENGLEVILCVGESLIDRENQRSGKRVSDSVNAGLDGLLKANRSGSLMIAYEPIWAIGTGQAAEPLDAAAMNDHIRMLASRRFRAGRGSTIPVLYGGSVSPENASEFLREADIDGFLVGGAGLDPVKAGGIIEEISAWNNTNERLGAEG